ncbi:MAG: hypothetical protein D6732_17245, partial [Methanobacteriota archaeon]
MCRSIKGFFLAVLMTIPALTANAAAGSTVFIPNGIGNANSLSKDWRTVNLQSDQLIYMFSMLMGKDVVEKGMGFVGSGAIPGNPSMNPQQAISNASSNNIQLNSSDTLVTVMLKVWNNAMLVILSTVFGFSVFRTIYAGGRTGSFLDTGQNQGAIDSHHLASRSIFSALMLFPAWKGLPAIVLIIMGSVGIGLSVANTIYAQTLRFLMSGVPITSTPITTDLVNGIKTLAIARVCYDYERTNDNLDYNWRSTYYDRNNNRFYFGYGKSKTGNNIKYCAVLKGWEQINVAQDCNNYSSVAANNNHMLAGLKLGAQINDAACTVTDTIHNKAPKVMKKTIWESKELKDISNKFLNPTELTNLNRVWLDNQVRSMITNFTSSINSIFTDSTKRAFSGQNTNLINLDASTGNMLVDKQFINMLTDEGIASAGTIYWIFVQMQDGMDKATKNAMSALSGNLELNDSMVNLESIKWMADSLKVWMDDIDDDIGLSNAVMAFQDSALSGSGRVRHNGGIVNSVKNFFANQHVTTHMNAEATVTNGLLYALTVGDGGSTIPIMKMRTIGDNLINMFTAMGVSTVIVKLFKGNFMAKTASSVYNAVKGVFNTIGNTKIGKKVGSFVGYSGGDLGGNGVVGMLVFSLLLGLMLMGFTLAYLLPA